MYGWESGFQVKNIRQRTAEALAAQFNIDNAQAVRVRNTALMLFEQIGNWKNRRQIKELKSMIKWASLLHEVGISINHNGVNRHSAYIIAHRDLPGFDSEQQNLLALLMRHHLKSFKLSDIRSTTRYQHRDILTLLRLFRLAVLLNRARQATSLPQHMKLTAEKSNWLLQFSSDFLAQNPLIAADLDEERKLLEGLELGLDYQ